METVVELTSESWPLIYSVKLLDGDYSRGEYMFTLEQEEYQKLSVGGEPLEVVEAIFSYLLDHESPESIMDDFGISEIETYLPEFWEEIQEYL